MNPKHECDEWLMAEVAQGKRNHLEPLIRRHASPLLTFIRRMVGDAHHSEEIFQEVFLAVWTKRRQYQTARPFKPWLYGIAVNKCRESFRGQRPPTLDLAAHLSAAPEPSPSDQLIATETATIVAHAVTQLPPQQRAVVVLRIWEGLSYADIAETVGRTEATVRSHMHHGLIAMRKYLEPRLS